MILFFGVWSPDQKGHFMYAPDGRTISRRELPDELSGGRFDGGDLAPPGGINGPQKIREMRYQVVQTTKGPWSIVSMWDRSADTRFNSCAAFLADGTLSADEVMTKARINFPVVTTRIESKT